MGGIGEVQDSVGKGATTVGRYVGGLFGLVIVAGAVVAAVRTRDLWIAVVGVVAGLVVVGLSQLQYHLAHNSKGWSQFFGTMFEINMARGFG